MTDDPYLRVLQALRDHGRQVQERGPSTASVQCPVHPDNRASATVSRGDRQGVVFNCKGCGATWDDFRAALGLDREALGGHPEQTVWTTRGDAVAVYPYRDEAGQLLYEVCRTADKQFPVRVPDPTQQSGYRWKMGNTRRVLYRLPEVIAAVAAGRPIFVCEGEKDVATLVGLGLDATCNPGGAGGGWRPEYSEHLRGANVMVIADADANGRKHARKVCDALADIAATVEIAEPAVGCKDATDHVAKFGGLDGLIYDQHPAEPVGTRAEQPEPGARLFGDVAALLAGGIPEPPAPERLRREDGHALLYAGKVNVLFGDPECGKTWIALAAIVEALRDGGRAAFIDLDHNGMAEVVSRLLLLGAKPADLGDLERFRYAEPEDAEQLALVIRALRAWRPSAAVVDSIGEALPMLGLSSNSPDDYTTMNRTVLTPLSTAGAVVIGIDHLPKDDEARKKGQTGTLAKRRTVNGVTLRVSVHETFAPGQGGSASMTVTKDRPGGVRAHCPMTGKEQSAGRFVMKAYPDGGVRWFVTAPAVVPEGAPDGDLAELDALDPPPRSQRDVQERCGWGGTRALQALRKWRDLRGHEEV